MTDTLTVCQGAADVFPLQFLDAADAAENWTGGNVELEWKSSNGNVIAPAPVFSWTDIAMGEGQIAFSRAAASAAPLGRTSEIHVVATLNGIDECIKIYIKGTD